MKKTIVFFVCFTFMTQGCSTLNSSTQQIKIACTPSDGVTLIVNSQKQLQCPIQMDVPRNKKLTIEAVKDNYFLYSKTVDYHLNGIGTLDAIGIAFTFFSVFGLLSAGAWDLDETSIDVILSKNK
jgi:hypothetical protein